MPSNQINNNDETFKLLNIEALVHVYFSKHASLIGRVTIEEKIKLQLAELNEVRGYEFDTEACAKDLLEQVNREYDESVKLSK